ncbi:hypothetical protein RMR10_011830 [Agrobacterium rosae]|nr:hypothetical protein [Agrobacterium rosae]MDX8313317.1 hypothetical protein [Agrobacterium rosae]
MVAGDRSDLYHLQASNELVDVGTWQIALKSAIKQYLPEVTPPQPNNDGPLPATPRKRVNEG